MNKVRRISSDDFAGIVADDWLKITYISHHHFNELIKLKGGKNAITLYLFYNMHSQKQKTDKIKATINFAAKGLHLGHKKIRKAKQILRNMGLIEDISVFNPITNRITGWYIHLIYVSKKANREAFEDHHKSIMLKQESEKSHPCQNGQGGIKKAKSHPCQNSTGWASYINAYRNTKVLNINALRKIKILKSKSHSFGSGPSRYFLWDTKNLFFLNYSKIQRNSVEVLSKTNPRHPQNKFYLYAAEKLKKINEDHFPNRKFAEADKWAKEIRLLVQSEMGCKGFPTKEIKKRIKVVLKYYSERIGMQYTHELKCGKSFRKKFFDVEDATKAKRKQFNQDTDGDLLTNDFTYEDDDE